MICGPNSVGKSYLADTIAIEALNSNYRVLSRPPLRSLNDLHAVRAGGTHSHVLACILRCDLLVLNDFGLQVLSTLAAQVLHENISERFERSSLIMSSNRAFDVWTEFFNNDLLASAAMDRLTHHAGRRAVHYSMARSGLFHNKARGDRDSYSATVFTRL